MKRWTTHILMCMTEARDVRNETNKEIGISAVRGGTIVGEHEVIFAGVDEVIELQAYGLFQKRIWQRGGRSSQIPGRTAGGHV